MKVKSNVEEWMKKYNFIEPEWVRIPLRFILAVELRYKMKGDSFQTVSNNGI